MKYKLNINSSIGKDELNSGLYPVIIYQLIRQYTNVNNKITVDDIKETLMSFWKGDDEKESSSKNLQRTIKRNLASLLYFDTDIQAEDKDGNPFEIDSGESIGKIYRLWYEQELAPIDVQLLADAVVYSRHLKDERRKELLKKLMLAAGQPSAIEDEWYWTTIRDSESLSIPTSGDLYRCLDYVNEAIKEHRCLSFAYTLHGPNNRKIVMREYKGISPYKIIHEKGIYYMLGAKTPHGAYTYDYKAKLENIAYFEIHKMEGLRFDYDDRYVPVEETVANGKNLEELLSGGYNLYNNSAVPFWSKEDVYFGTNEIGLDALYDRFGERVIAVEPRKELIGKDMRTKYTYRVTVREVGKTDWDEILILLFRISPLELGLIETSRQKIEELKEKVEKMLDVSQWKTV